MIICNQLRLVFIRYLLDTCGFGICSFADELPTFYRFTAASGRRTPTTRCAMLCEFVCDILPFQHFSFNKSLWFQHFSSTRISRQRDVRSEPKVKFGRSFSEVSALAPYRCPTFLVFLPTLFEIVVEMWQIKAKKLSNSMENTARDISPRDAVMLSRTSKVKQNLERQMEI
ncbi:Hypothetical_protein [Hexamita inflata]|uniref:Hypothetical_protein n=1 Tax=Hexamita inflata TaxID=28002 RepID=A0AA86QLM5_9EUKA|nr:Hypothetical protein HINF_LOCUS48148 [Hexamita inflata]